MRLCKTIDKKYPKSGDKLGPIRMERRDEPELSGVHALNVMPGLISPP